MKLAHTGKVLLIANLLLFSSLFSNATHIIGTEISYKCFGNGSYEFTATIYRDCNPGNAQFDYPAQFTFFDGNGDIINDLTQYVNPTDSSFVTYTSENPCIIVPPNSCVQMAIYKFTVTLPQRQGGYMMTYQRCCRNQSVLNIVNPTATGSTNFVVIDDYTYSLCNSSPVYKSYPPIVICNGERLEFDHSAVDEDGDSLSYELCQPYTSSADLFNPVSPPPFTGVTYRPGYSADNPMKGTEPLAIDAKTGLLTVTPDTKGRFVAGICVNEYRNGTLIGHYLRDFQFIVVSCEKTVAASFPDEIGPCDSSTVIHFKNNTKGGNIFHWDFGVNGTSSDTTTEQNPVYTYPGYGTYAVTLHAYKTGSECGDTATGTVTIYPPMRAFKDTAIIFGTTGKLRAINAKNYQWEPASSVENNTDSVTFVNPTVTTTYTVTGYLPNGCPDTQMVVVTVLKDPIVKFADAFSPDGNGRNEFFRPMYIGASSLIGNVEFKVFNRWGQLMFESTDPKTRGWNGTNLKGEPQPVGVYVYFFSGVGTDLGTPFNFKGNVTLLK